MQSRDAASELVDFEVVRTFDEAASWAITEAVRHDVAVLICGADIGYQDSNVLVLKRDQIPSPSDFMCFVLRVFLCWENAN